MQNNLIDTIVVVKGRGWLGRERSGEVGRPSATAQGTNRRAVVTNRPGAFVLPGAAYEAYADRGESENRNKELKRGLQADRLSDHRYFANLFRLYLHAAAYNLLVRLRHAVADPPLPSPPHDVPIEALGGRPRRQWHNRRREHDPLGEGQPCTWRTRLIKVAARVASEHTSCDRGTLVQLALPGAVPENRPASFGRKADLSG